MSNPILDELKPKLMALRVTNYDDFIVLANYIHRDDPFYKLDEIKNIIINFTNEIYLSNIIFDIYKENIINKYMFDITITYLGPWLTFQPSMANIT